MSRQLKFRVWLGTRFWFFDITSGFNEENTDVCSEPEQFTGLQDRNGKDVYDGDILKDHSNRRLHIFYCEKHHRWELESLNTAMFANHPVIDWFDDFTKKHNDLPEIIGNIHE